MVKIWIFEGAGHWFSLAVSSVLAVAAMMFLNHPAAAFGAFSVSMVLLLCLTGWITGLLAGQREWNKEDRQSGNIFGFLGGMTLSVIVFAPVLLLIFR